MQKRLIEINEELTQIETRAAEIKGTVETAEHDDLEKLSGELTDMESRKADLIREKAEIEAKEEEARSFDESKATKISLNSKGENKMTLNEVRSSKAYIDAYAEYIKEMMKNGKADDSELRALLSDAITVSGTAGVPTPTLVEDRINTAWEKNDILSRVKKTAIKGNLKVGFELSASAAVVHTEGAAAPTEETLNIGVVELIPETLKKWISVSDEVFDMHGTEFLNYIMDEIEYRIVKLAADRIIADITGSPTTATTSAASVANISISAASIHDFVDAEATLSDEAANPVVIMNKASYATYKGLQMAANYGVDPFDGMPVIFNDTLYAAGTATTGQAIAIVGDLNGVQANFPNGQEPTLKYDDLSLAEKDLVKIVGRLPFAHDVVACGRFCVIKKS